MYAEFSGRPLGNHGEGGRACGNPTPAPSLQGIYIYLAYIEKCLNVGVDYLDFVLEALKTLLLDIVINLSSDGFPLPESCM